MCLSVGAYVCMHLRVATSYMYFNVFVLIHTHIYSIERERERTKAEEERKADVLYISVAYSS